MFSDGRRSLAGPGYSRKQIIQPSPEVQRGFPPDPKDLLVTQSFGCAPFELAPFDFAPFDYAPFDCAPFDYAQGLRQGLWQGLRHFDQGSMSAAIAAER